MSQRVAPIGTTLALLLLLPLAGCSSLGPGPIQSPLPYPDRTGPDEVLHTFLWAWKMGDVPVLEQVLGGGMRNTLRKQIAANGREKTAAFYRDDQLELLELDWVDRGEALCQVRITLRGTRTGRAEIIFGCVRRRPEDWTVSGKKIIPR